MLAVSITFLVANTLSEFSIDFVSAQDTESVQPVSSQELDQLTNLYLAAVFAGETRKATSEM